MENSERPSWHYIPENARIGDCYSCVKFNACIKKCTIYLKFRVMPPNYNE